MPFTKQAATGNRTFEPYPPGVYSLEIETAKVEIKESKKGKDYEKIYIKTKIVSGPKDGKTLYLNFFLDEKVGQLISLSLGLDLEKVFGGRDQLPNPELEALVIGKFVKARIGVTDKGYNELVEFLSKNYAEDDDEKDDIKI